MLNSLPVLVLRITGIWKHARHRREVADIAVEDAEQRSDGRLVRLDAIEVADPRPPAHHVRFEGKAECAGSPARSRWCKSITMKGEHMTFNPWNCLEQHRPLGSINRMRLALYLASLQVRWKLNMVAS